jgi:hypothetical protein
MFMDFSGPHPTPGHRSCSRLRYSVEGLAGEAKTSMGRSKEVAYEMSHARLLRLS